MTISTARTISPGMGWLPQIREFPLRPVEPGTHLSVNATISYTDRARSFIIGPNLLRHPHNRSLVHISDAVCAPASVFLYGQLRQTLPIIWSIEAIPGTTVEVYRLRQDRAHNGTRFVAAEKAPEHEIVGAELAREELDCTIGGGTIPDWMPAYKHCLIDSGTYLLKITADRQPHAPAFVLCDLEYRGPLVQADTVAMDAIDVDL